MLTSNIDAVRRNTALNSRCRFTGRDGRRSRASKLAGRELQWTTGYLRKSQLRCWSEEERRTTTHEQEGTHVDNIVGKSR